MYLRHYYHCDTITVIASHEVVGLVACFGSVLLGRMDGYTEYSVSRYFVG